MKTSNSFLLRYQELCLMHQSGAAHSGTKTATKVHAEQPDNDAHAASLSILPRPSSSGDTLTQTSIANDGQEQDQDRHLAQMPVLAGTRTKTKIKGEHAGDIAPGEAGVLAVPRQPVFAIAQTKTITAVKAEADDNDPRRASLEAIPKCF